MSNFRLNLPEIESDLKALQQNFDRINQGLSTPRDAMTDEVCTNMMAGYCYIDNALAQNLDLFELGNSKRLLELNTMVLCGQDKTRQDRYAKHIRSNEDRFYNKDGGGIGVIMEWLQHHKYDDVWKRAAGVYIHILSRPELYIEGNHRTGALIMSYILAREGQPPFVLTVHNASAFLNPSALAKTFRNTGFSMLWQMPRLTRRFAKLIEQESHKRYLLIRHGSDGSFGYDSLACKR